MINETGSSFKNREQKNFDTIFQNLPGISVWISYTANINHSLRYSENVIKITGYTSIELDALPDKHHYLVDKAYYLTCRRQLDIFVDENLKEELELEYIIE